jgi:hypothetical protein
MMKGRDESEAQMSTRMVGVVESMDHQIRLKPNSDVGEVRRWRASVTCRERI